MWAAAITNFSGDRFSSGKTKRFLTPYILKFLPNATEELIDAINFTIRKTAHVVEYGLMAMLIFSVFAVGMTRWRKIWSLYAIFFCFLIAVSDEYRQKHSQLRTGALEDLMIDLAGAIVFIAFLRIVFKDRYDASGKNLKSV